MSIERTFTLRASKNEDVLTMLTYQASYHDHSFGYDGPFGPACHKQGGFEVDRWELSISKRTLGWKSITLDCLEVPEDLYDTLNELCEKHLKDNPPQRLDPYADWGD